MASTVQAQTFQEIVSLVQTLETAYPNDNWLLTAARIRKSYYTGFFWSLLMLKNIALKTPSAQQGLSRQILNQLQKEPLIFYDPQGNSVDFRHACTAIEALASPRFNRILYFLSGVSVPAVISWSGDVGSVITEYARTRGQYGDLKHYYGRFANPCDLFGDVDGYALFHLGQRTPSDRLSTQLREYYERKLDQRFELFSQEAALSLTAGSHPRRLTRSAEREIQQQISRFAFWVVLWKIVRRSPNRLRDLTQFFTRRSYNQDHVNQVSRWFIQWINRRLG